MLGSILIGVTACGLPVLATLIYKRLSDARSVPRRQRKIKARLPMSEAAFIAGYGRPLTAEEADLVLGMRRALSLASDIEPSLLYPHDGMLDFFTDWAAEFEAVTALLQEMDGHLIAKYGLNLDKIKSPDFHGNMEVTEFFDSVIGASCLPRTDAE